MLLRSVIGPVIGGGLVLFAFGGCGGETFEGSGAGAMAGTSGAGGQSGNAGNGGSANAGSGGASGDAGNGGGGGGGNGGRGSGGSVGNGGAGNAGGSVGNGGAGNAGGSAGVGGGGTAGTGGTGLPPEWLACADTSECMVRESSCCQACGPQELNQALAFNRKYGDDVTRMVCGPIPPPCPAVRCAPTPQYVLPFCIEGRCQAIDIRSDKLTSCSTEAECRLRWGTTCCEPCGTPPLNMLVAVNSQVNYDQTVCGMGIGCPDCITAPYPTTARTRCDTDHRCRVALPLP